MLLRENFARGFILMTMPEVKEKEDQAITPRMTELLYELKRAAQAYQSNYGRCKELVKAIVEQGRNDGIIDLQIRELIDKTLSGIISERSIRSYIPKELKAQGQIRRQIAADSYNDQIEQTSTSNTESDDIDETHDPRSENIIQDKVNASMNAALENKIRSELQREIDSLRQQLEDKEGINELLKREIEESKNLKLEARILDIEELNRNLKIENEQLRHALTKHSFETAAEVKEKNNQADPDLVANLEFYIKKLEHEANSKDKVIQELYQKIESFSHIDRVVEHQPLELDLTDKGGFLGQFFSYRGRKVKVVHDGIKITNVRMTEVSK